MDTTTRTCAAGLALLATASLTGLVAPAGAAPAERATQRLSTTLRPSGDVDGSGTATLTLNKARRTVCATITWRNIEAPDAAHIHRASDGGIVVDLHGSVTGGPRCATGVPKRTIARILAHPRRYYVNVHNPTYPAGAIQGTLHR
ncbi:CHRD domain-containing protein [Nocardioides sp. MAH-18]|uniref:CHRD domain-containing protein n=1 Tax=Nocardioides agri TaxID=2682843 RepID=A0A6L6XU51_9ACTN|nr:MULTISPECIES: CHRD domain-containing protein [unclassified Nocardioides]MBA2955698.1 CHRD domain-containing protein [Nocardioides sp. CGMCC 1.13656]MVQ50548.1 CHRD domain-containing protein [Nocardioides sp. MAH-18]